MWGVRHQSPGVQLSEQDAAGLLASAALTLGAGRSLHPRSAELIRPF
jgi:hypothetical protein